jgi:lipoprotein-releasing system permease protein
MEWLDVVLIALAAIIISFLATIYPSWQASKLNPVEALRYE